MIRPGFIAVAEAPITAALRGSRRFLTFRRGRLRERGRRAADPPLSVDGDPAAVGGEEERVHLQLLERQRVGLPGLRRLAEGRARRRRAPRAAPPSRRGRGGASRGGGSAGRGARRRVASRPPARAPRGRGPAGGRRSTSRRSASPNHSVRTPPRPRTRTGPNAGSCLRERSVSEAGEPPVVFTFSTTRTPERAASGIRRPTSSQTRRAAARDGRRLGGRERDAADVRLVEDLRARRSSGRRSPGGLVEERSTPRPGGPLPAPPPRTRSRGTSKPAAARTA